MLPRFQPDRLNWPWTPEQMEALDNMLEELYGDVAGQNRGLNAVAKGDIIYGSATDTLAGLAIGAAGKVLRSDGTLPAWSTFTIPDTFALGDFIYASAANVLTARTVGAVGTVIRSDGTPNYSTFTIPDTFVQGDIIYASAASVLTALAKNTTATRYLSNTGSSNNPAWAQVNLANGVTGALGATNGGTGQTTVVTGDLLYGSATDTWSRLSAGLAGRYLRGGGAATAPAWSTVVLPNSLTQYQIVYAANTNQMDGQIALGTSGQVLISNGAGAVASFQTQNLLSASHADTAASAVTRGDLIIGNSTPAWDNLAISVTAGTFLRSDGTDPGWSTLVLPNAITTGSIVFGSATNTYGQDNANLFWDDTNNRLGIGTTSPSYPVVIDTSINGLAAGQPSVVIQGVGNKERFSARSFGTTPGAAFQGVGAGGTIASPTQTLSGKSLLIFGGGGYDNAGTPAETGNKAIIGLVAAENFTTAAQGTYIAFETTPIGSTSRAEKVRIHDSGGLSIGGSTDPGNGNIQLGGGQIVFPATQSASSGANTLDDYEEGTWTPVATFVTPGDLSTAYTTQVGTYTKIGHLVTVLVNITLSTWTHTTASGNLNITGLPFTSETRTGGNYWGAAVPTTVDFEAGYTFMYVAVGSNVTNIIAAQGGDNVANDVLSTTNLPTGVTPWQIQGTITYRAAN